MGQEMWRICNKVYRGKGYPNQWRKGLWRSIEESDSRRWATKFIRSYSGKNQKGRQKESFYLSSLYFKLGIRIINKIYVLNYLVRRNLGRKKENQWLYQLTLKRRYKLSEQKDVMAGYERGRSLQVRPRVFGLKSKTSPRTSLWEGIANSV